MNSLESALMLIAGVLFCAKSPDLMRTYSTCAAAIIFLLVGPFSALAADPKHCQIALAPLEVDVERIAASWSRLSEIEDVKFKSLQMELLNREFVSLIKKHGPDFLKKVEARTSELQGKAALAKAQVQSARGTQQASEVESIFFLNRERRHDFSALYGRIFDLQLRGDNEIVVLSEQGIAIHDRITGALKSETSHSFHDPNLRLYLSRDLKYAFAIEPYWITRFEIDRNFESVQIFAKPGEMSFGSTRVMFSRDGESFYVPTSEEKVIRIDVERFSRTGLIARVSRFGTLTESIDGRYIGVSTGGLGPGKIIDVEKLTVVEGIDISASSYRPVELQGESWFLPFNLRTAVSKLVEPQSMSIVPSSHLHKDSLFAVTAEGVLIEARLIEEPDGPWARWNPSKFSRVYSILDPLTGKRSEFLGEGRQVPHFVSKFIVPSAGPYLLATVEASAEAQLFVLLNSATLETRLIQLAKRVPIDRISLVDDGKAIFLVTPQGSIELY